MAAKVLGVDHTGITVSSLDRSLALWRDVLGFELIRTFELTGSFAAALAALADADCAAVGEPLAIPGGARKGSLFAYVHDPDGVTLELIQLASSQPEQPGGTS